MPWVRVDDRHRTDPIWAALVENDARRVPALRDAFMSLMCEAASHLTDGYLTTDMVEAALAQHAPKDQREFPELLCRSVLGRPARLHRQGDECPCVPRGWSQGWDFYIHAFLSANPTAREKRLRDAKRRDLNDPALRKLVFRRDRGYCRYCWSGPLNPKLGRAQFPEAAQLMPCLDHVDPDVPAMADGSGVVTACKRCNELKGRCTPEVVGMPLLSIPSDEVIARLPVNFHGKYVVLGLPSEVSDHPANQNRNGSGSSRQSSDRADESIGELSGDHVSVHARESDPEDGFSSRHPTDHPPDRDPSLSGTGRVGSQVGRSDDDWRDQWRPEPRDPSTPDPYTRQSRPSPDVLSQLMTGGRGA